MSTIDDQIKELKKSIINLIKINYGITDIKNSNTLLKNNDREKFKKIKELITKISTEITKNESNIPSLKKLYNFYDDLDNYSITFKRIPEPITASLKLKKLDLKVINSRFNIKDEKLKFSKFKELLKEMSKNIIPNADTNFDYNELISKLKIPLDKKKINDAVIKRISFKTIKTNITLTTYRLKSIREKIINYKNIINVTLNPTPRFKLLSPYLKDIQDLTGGNDNTYKKFYKKNEKYFLRIYYILYKYYDKLLTNLITDTNQQIKISYELLNLKNIYTEYTIFFGYYQKLKIIYKQPNNSIFFKHYFQIFIIYYFLKCILLKFNPDNTKTKEEYEETYISFDINNNSDEELELEKLIILFIKSISN